MIIRYIDDVSSPLLAHAAPGIVEHLESGSDAHTEVVFHATKYDGQVGPTAQFFLSYYPLVFTFSGLLLFAALQFRRKQQ